MSKPTAYSLLAYGEMIAAGPRTEAYAQALREAVRPGCVVLDIGAGTGIFSLLACQYGAGHVHAVEPDHALMIGQAMAAANGFAEKISFHQVLSSALTLQQPADVIISDLRGTVPLFQNHIPAMADVRRRLLAPGGILIAQQDTLLASLVDDAQLYQPYCGPWLRNPQGLDLTAARPFVLNTWRKVRVQRASLLVAPQLWGMVDYRTVVSPNITGTLAWRIDHPRTTHGLLLWFDTQLADGIGFSNAPGQPELVYGQAFFPLLEPVALEAGDEVRVALRADLVNGEYEWSWSTRILAASGVAKADSVNPPFSPPL